MIKQLLKFSDDLPADHLVIRVWRPDGINTRVLVSAVRGNEAASVELTEEAIKGSYADVLLDWDIAQKLNAQLS